MNIDPVNVKDVVGGIGAVYYRRVSRNEHIRLVFQGDVEYKWLLLLNVMLWQNRGSTASEC